MVGYETQHRLIDATGPRRVSRDAGSRPMGHCRSLQARSCDYLNKVFAENDEGIERRGVPLQITVRHQDEYGDDCMTVQATPLDVFN